MNYNASPASSNYVRARTNCIHQLLLKHDMLLELQQNESYI